MYRGFYINLDARRDRRRHMEAELKRFRLASHYIRIPAIAHEVGAVGCFHSHIKAIHQAHRSGGLAHILEDDVLLSDRLAPFLASARLVTLLAQYDIIFLSMWVDPTRASIDRYTAAQAAAGDGLAVVDVRETRLGSMDSYVVAPRSLGRIGRMLADHARTGPSMPVDAFLDRKVRQNEIRAGVVVPFLTCVDVAHGARSAIQVAPQPLLEQTVMLRTAFFVDRSRQPFLVPASSE